MNNMIIASRLQQDPVAFCDAYKELVFQLQAQDKRIILGDADLGRAIYGADYAQLKADNPYGMYDVGIAEANLVGVACGLSVYGRIPIVHSFSAFITRRTFDTFFVSAAYAGLNVKLIGSDPGICSTYNGGTHTTFEDAGLIRAVPGAVIFEPADNQAMRSLLPKLVEEHGVMYMRMPRKMQPMEIYAPGTKLEKAKAMCLHSGTDATVIAMGTQVIEALKAAELLAEKGISLRVLDIVTLSPLDEEAVLKAAQETGAIVTAENHSIRTGLNAAVSQLLSEKLPCPVEAIGIRDRFGQVGNYEELLKAYNLSYKDIAHAAEKCISRKKSL